MIANLENRAFILILLIVAASFLYLLAPFYAAIFWASILAILFHLLRKNQRLNNPPRSAPYLRHWRRCCWSSFPTVHRRSCSDLKP